MNIFKYSIPLWVCLISFCFVACGSDAGDTGINKSSSYVDENGDTLSVKIKSGSFTDPRDGQSYKTVQIGQQIWMAENLNYGKLGYCPDSSSSNCAKYGRLYNYSEAREACPTGWHFSTEEEWLKLIATVRSLYPGSEARVLKSSTGWAEFNYGTDALGFGVLPAGYAENCPEHPCMRSKGYEGYFWTETILNEHLSQRYLAVLSSGDTSFISWTHFSETSYASLRCVNDTNTIVGALGHCDEVMKGTVRSYNDSSYICKDWSWVHATKSEALGECSDSVRRGIYNDTLFVCRDFNFWEHASLPEAMGECDSTKTGVFGKYLGHDYICQDSFWRYALDVEVRYGFCDASKSQTIKTVDSLEYFCNGNFWHERNIVEKELGFCTKDKNGETGIYDGLTFTCDAGKNLWRSSFVDPRDTSEYAAVAIDDKIWMAENLNYQKGGSCTISFGHPLFGCGSRPMGRLYSWASALELPDSANFSAYPMENREYQGLCPSGWHIPDTTEWASLVKYVQLRGLNKSVFSENGWYNSLGTDLYGFKALPAVDYSHIGEGEYAIFWASDGQSFDGKIEESYAASVEMDTNYGTAWQFYFSVSGSYKNKGAFIRCIKD